MILTPTVVVGPTTSASLDEGVGAQDDLEDVVGLKSYENTVRI